MSVILWLCLVGSLVAQTPVEVALKFLDTLQKGPFNEEESALESRTSKARLENIRAAHLAIKKELRAETRSAALSKVSGNFAAVIVSQAGELNGDGLQVFPVALVKKEDKWLPAPLLGTFANAIPLYTVEIRPALLELEDWMAKNRVTVLRSLTEGIEDRFKGKIAESIDQELLRGENLNAIAKGFLDACNQRNEMVILAYLGGLSEPWPSDWEERKALAKRMSDFNDRNSNPFRVFNSADVIRVPIREKIKGDRGTVNLSYLDPGTNLQIPPVLGKIVFSFSKDEGGRWVLDTDALTATRFTQRFEKTNKNFEAFIKKIKSEQERSTVTTLEEASESIIRILQGGTFREAILEVFFNDNAEEETVAIVEAAQTWKTMRLAKGAVLWGEPSIREEENFAVATISQHDLNDAEASASRALLFEKSGDVWHWVPESVLFAQPLENNGEFAANKLSEEQLVAFKKLYDKELLGKENQIDLLMKQRILRIDKMVPEAPPSEAAAKEFALNWLNNLSNKNAEGVLSKSAWLGKKNGKPTKALKKIKEILARGNSSSYGFSKLYRSDQWTAMELSHRNQNGEELKTFVPILSTESGLRVLPEVEFFIGGRKSKKFINRIALLQLKKVLPRESYKDLEQLFKQFSSSAR